MAATFSKEERAALRELARERKANESRAEALEICMAKINSMHPDDREIALAVHELALKVNPEFEVKTWYGMPGYFMDGKVILFFQDGHKFKTRYCTLGFQDAAKLDDGEIWPTSFAVQKINSVVSREITRLIEKAVGSR